jgi:uncharacterized membrane protein YhaH (DUF805 family)
MTTRPRFSHAPLALLLGPSGAIGRVAFLSGHAVLALAALSIDGLARPVLGGPTGFALVLLVAWSAGCLARKRLHDLGLSGMVIAYFLAAYIGIVLIVACTPDFAGRGAIAAAVAAGPALGWILWLGLAPSRMRQGRGRPALA